MLTLEKRLENLMVKEEMAKVCGQYTFEPAIYAVKRPDGVTIGYATRGKNIDPEPHNEGLWHYLKQDIRKLSWSNSVSNKKREVREALEEFNNDVAYGFEKMKCCDNNFCYKKFYTS